MKLLVPPYFKFSGYDKLQHEMYWNNIYDEADNTSDADKLQHEMYWNSDVYNPIEISGQDKLQHEMYWNASQQ